MTTPQSPFGAVPQCDHCGEGLSAQGGEELRCGCGNLLARLVPGGVEVKCRRCKRAVILPVSLAGLKASRPAKARGVPMELRGPVT